MTRNRSIAYLNMLIVSAYKLIGFAVLTTILIGLASYLGVNLFYFVDRSWVAPIILAPTDPRVLQLNEQLTEQSSQRDKLIATRHELKARLDDTVRVVAAEEDFQKSFGRAVQADLLALSTDLRKLHGLTNEVQSAKKEIRTSEQVYQDLSRQRIQELYDAHLLDHDGLVNGHHQLAELVRSNLGLAQDEVNLAVKKAALQREVLSLQILARKNARGRGQPLSHDGLRIKQEYVRSLLEAAKAKDSGQALQRGIEAIDRSIARYDRIIKAIEDAPYIKAVEHNLTIAFVPYENLKRIAPGAPLYGCRLGLLWCPRVGQVAAVLSGETTMNHPVHNQLMRGQMVQVELDEGTWAEQKVLFAGRKPLFL